MTDKNNFVSRRTFLKILGGAALVAGGAVAFKDKIFPFAEETAPEIVGEHNVRFLRQIVTRNMALSRVIMWQTGGAADGQAIEYREKGGETMRAPAQDASFSDDGDTVWQYAAELNDLSAGKDYEYRVTAKNAAGEWRDFRTKADDSFKAIIFPDSQSADYGVWEMTAQSAARLNPDADFFVNMGDIVDNGEDSSQWRAWLAALHGIRERIPFVPVMGNHETYNREWKVRLPEAYLNYFIVPANGSEKFSRYYYSFDVGAVHFVVLNSQWEETDEFKDGLIDEQKDWLRRDMKENAKKFSVALIHKDVLQYRIHNRPERREGFSDVGEIFMPLFDELGFDVVFTAHLHTYRNRGRIFDFARSNRGPLYILTGVAGDVRYPNLWIDHALDEAIAPQPETDNFLTFEASGEKLVIASFLPDGTRIDYREITK